MEGGKEVNSAKEKKTKEDASRFKVDGSRGSHSIYEPCILGGY